MDRRAASLLQLQTPREAEYTSKDLETSRVDLSSRARVARKSKMNSEYQSVILKEA